MTDRQTETDQLAGQTVKDPNGVRVPLDQLTRKDGNR
jgi:hypothetical protein